MDKKKFSELDIDEQVWIVYNKNYKQFNEKGEDKFAVLIVVPGTILNNYPFKWQSERTFPDEPVIVHNDYRMHIKVEIPEESESVNWIEYVKLYEDKDEDYDSIRVWNQNSLGPKMIDVYKSKEDAISYAESHNIKQIAAIDYYINQLAKEKIEIQETINDLKRFDYEDFS